MVRSHTARYSMSWRGSHQDIMAHTDLGNVPGEGSSSLAPAQSCCSRFRHSSVPREFDVQEFGEFFFRSNAYVEPPPSTGKGEEREW